MSCHAPGHIKLWYLDNWRVSDPALGNYCSRPSTDETLIMQADMCAAFPTGDFVIPYAARNMLAARSGNDTSRKVTLFYSITLLPLLVSFNVEDSQTHLYFGRSGDRG